MGPVEIMDKYLTDAEEKYVTLQEWIERPENAKAKLSFDSWRDVDRDYLRIDAYVRMNPWSRTARGMRAELYRKVHGL